MTATWTDDQRDAMVELWNAGCSSTKICTRLGSEWGVKLTRNMVIGVIARERDRREKLSYLGASMTQVVDHSRHLATPRPKVVHETRLKPRSIKQSHILKGHAPEGQFLVTSSSQTPLMLPLEQLGRFQCRWPIGDPGHVGFGFCGLPVVEGASYCLACSKIAYTKPATDAQRSAAAKARAEKGAEMARVARR